MCPQPAALIMLGPTLRWLIGMTDLGRQRTSCMASLVKGHPPDGGSILTLTNYQLSLAI